MTSSRLNRDGLRRLSDLRAEEARLLLDNGYYSGAYYLAGYAVECALKACIAKQVQQHDFPDLRRVRRSHDHKLGNLIVVAGLDSELHQEISVNQIFSTNWKIVSAWTVDPRYENHSHTKAAEFLAAITDANTGVLPWIRRRW